MVNIVKAIKTEDKSNFLHQVNCDKDSKSPLKEESDPDISDVGVGPGSG